MNNYQQKVLEYYANGFNCSQAIFTTFTADMGIDRELALKISTQFGGGARKGEMCGAVSGALMVLGMKYGHCHQGNLEEKSRAYAISEEFMNRFIKENGSVVCRELLKYDLSVPEQAQKIREQNLFKTLCPNMISSAAEILAQLMAEIDRGETL